MSIQTQDDMVAIQQMLQKVNNTFKSGGDPRRMISNMDFSDDFNNFYSGTDDISQSSGTTLQSDAQSMLELRFLSEKRIGVGYNITHGFGEDALFNWFRPKKVDMPDGKGFTTVSGFNKWVVDTDFKNQAIQWDIDKRIYGIGLIVKFWSNHDKLDTPAPRGPPRKFQVVSPLYLAPINTWETRMLTYDEDVWEFFGGHLKPSKIHRSRLEVVRGPPQTDTFRGLSVIEPVYLSTICYYNGLIYLTRALAKHGNMVPILKSGSVTPTPDEYTNYLNLMTQFVMNGFFFIGKNDEIQYPTTNVGAGLFDVLEILKEDIASGTRIPLNKLFGRAESGGIGGEGALTAERTYLNLLSNEQTMISDDFLRIFKAAGFDFEGKELGWNLALQKTTQQQHAERAQELNNELLEMQVKQMKQEEQMLSMQRELFEKHKDSMNFDQQLGASEEIKEDFAAHRAKFTNIQEKIQYSDFQKLLRTLKINPRQVA